jgi:DNA-binding LytR/AlgR family response regulator
MTQGHSYIIAEDEPLLAQALSALLAQHWPDARCLAIAANGEEAIAAVAEYSPDVAFLDVRMPRCDGLEAARQVCTRDRPPLIVFVTAYDAYALQAFETAAVDYLLKPVDAERLLNCVERLRARLGQSTEPSSVAQMASRIAELLGNGVGTKQTLRYVRAGAGATVKLIPIQEVLWFEAQDKYITVATRDGDSIIRTSLRDLLAQLDADVFWQVHRGTVVNSQHIMHAKRDELGHVTLMLRGRKEPLAVSRQFAHLFKQM